MNAPLRPLIGMALAAPLLAALLTGCGGRSVSELELHTAPAARLPALERSLRADVESDPDDPEAAYRLGQVLLRRGSLAEAERFALQASTADPFHGRYTEGVGAVYLAQGRRFRALTAFSQAVQSDTGLLSAFVLLAQTHAALGDAEAALTTLDTALLQEPRYFPAKVLQARLLFLRGSLQQAAIAVADARAIRPHDASGRLLHIRIAHAQGRRALAETLLAEGLAATPGHPDLLRERLVMAVQRGDTAGARKALEALRTVATLGPVDRLAEVRLLRAEGRKQEAAAQMDAALATHPAALPLLEAHAADLLRSGKPDQALEVLRQAMESATLTAAGKYWRIVALFALNRQEEGGKLLDAALRDHPRDRMLLLLHARRDMQQRRLVQASARVAELLRERPGDEDGLLLNAELHMLRGDFAAAKSALGALAAQREQPLLRFAHAKLAYLEGRPAEAVRLTTPLMAETPVSWRWAYLHAAALARTGRTPEAEAALLPHREHPEGRAEVLLLLGDLRLRRGDARGAARLLAQGLAARPRHLGLLEAISRAEMQAGRWRETAGWLEPAVEQASPYRLLFLQRLRTVYTQLKDAAGLKRVNALYAIAVDPLLRETLPREGDQVPLLGVSVLTGSHLLRTD